MRLRTFTLVKMQNLIPDAFATATPISVIALRCFSACLLAGLIGLDREAHDQDAGIRTHMLTGLAAALFPLIAAEMIASHAGRDDATQLDPIRVVEAVTAGVAFIAAGSIIQRRHSVQGLTTGAGMWLAGAIGLACGAGYLAIAVVGTLTAILILWPLRLVKKRLEQKKTDPETSS